MYSRRFIFVLTAMVLMIAACSKSSSKEINEGQQAVVTDTTLLKNVTAKELQHIIASYKGDKAVLVNVWATWCIPCVEEFPEIVKIQRTYPEKLQVVFISADFPEKRKDALAFLKEHNVDWTTYFKTGKDEPFINAVSKDWSGALPFTKIISTGGEVVAYWEKKADFDTFNKHVKHAINP